MQNKKPTTSPIPSLKNIINETKVPLSRYIHKRIVANDKNMSYIEKLKSMLTNNGKYQYQYNYKNRGNEKFTYAYTQAHTISHNNQMESHMQNQNQNLNQQMQNEMEMQNQKQQKGFEQNLTIPIDKKNRRTQSILKTETKKQTPRLSNLNGYSHPTTTTNTNTKTRTNIQNTPSKKYLNTTQHINTSTYLNNSNIKNIINTSYGNIKNSIVTEHIGPNPNFNANTKQNNLSNRLRISQRRVTDHDLIKEIKTDLMRKRVISNNSTNLTNINNVIDQTPKNYSGNLNTYLNNYHNIQQPTTTKNNRNKYQVINYTKFLPVPLLISADPKDVQLICSKWGKMQLFTLLGSGANANVREGLCNGGRYAVKIYEKYKLLQPRKKKRVYSQIQLLKLLPQHPNIITMYQAFEDKRQIHVIFQQVDKSITLSQYFRNCMLYISQSQIQSIFGRIVRGVCHIHENGIAHRDLKPDNILITTDQDGEIIVKIIDFGYATNTNSADLQCGTPNFMAPQLLDKCTKYNPMCVDIWALGVMLFYLFQGRYPFKGYDQKDLFRSIKNNQFQFKKIVQPHIRSIIQSTLVMNPAERITARQLMEIQWILNI